MPLLSRRAALLAAPALLLAGRAAASSRPLRLVVPFEAGGLPDVFARLLAPALSEVLGQPAVVENQSGAASRLGTTAVLRAAPDGQTLLVTNDSLAATEALPPPGAEPLLPGLRPVTLAIAAPNILLTHPDSGLPDIAAYAERIRARPGEVNVAIPGWGTAHHLTSESLNRAVGGKVEHIPYRGAPQVLADLAAGRVQAGMLTLGVALEHLRDGRLKALALTSRDGSPLAPAIPTLHGTVAPGFDHLSFIGVLLPAGVPAEQAEHLHATIAAVLARPALRDRLTGLGFEVPAAPPAAFAARLSETVGRFAEAAGAAGLRLARA
ncbi:tripartite tricarboxylate transporter substrate binding protein [Roseomonas sp. OT10]|uniref:tripartite tricarboxylate transporter substrate binding protein n=1 Tax=Roseomonas cutis TaxID=2897332 RepID=UPI001E63F8CE|nr:tripartite tricarboxylate transporter substrate binding protein [Roseomonas sp. OT10]UFN48725.1 tripartite tricarboxylate transporter substrate binding protein [Roseomonas sp. OT10]